MISVLMPVRNGAAWIADAIASVRAQTRLPDELVIVDDGSTDNSMEIVADMWEPWFRVIPGPQSGLAAALQIGVESSSGDLIARLDADDVAAPDRLQRQEAAFRDSDLVLCGGWAAVAAENRNLRHFMPPTSASQVARYMGLSNPFVHSAVMFRRAPALVVGGYRAPPGPAYPEDYDLWLRLVDHGVAINLPHVLVTYRTHPGAITAMHSRALGLAAVSLASQAISQLIGAAPPSDVELAVLRSYHRVRQDGDRFSMRDVKRLLDRLANEGTRWAPGLDLSRETRRGLYAAAVTPLLASWARSRRQSGHPA